MDINKILSDIFSDSFKKTFASRNSLVENIHGKLRNGIIVSSQRITPIPYDCKGVAISIEQIELDEAAPLTVVMKFDFIGSEAPSKQISFSIGCRNGCLYTIKEDGEPEAVGLVSKQDFNRSYLSFEEDFPEFGRIPFSEIFNITFFKVFDIPKE